MSEASITVNMKDCKKYIFKQWKFILLLGIIVGAILGGSTLFYYIVQKGKGTSVSDEALAEYNEALTEYNETYTVVSNNLTIMKLREQSQMDYLNGTFYNMMDPNHVLYNTMDIAVELTTDDNNATAMDANDVSEDTKSTYLALVADGILTKLDWEALGEECGRNEMILKEVISVEPDYDSNVIHVEIIYPEQVFASRLLDTIEEQLDSIAEEYSFLGKGTFYCVNRDTEYRKNSDVITIRDNENNIYNNCKNQVKAIEEQLESLSEPAPVDGNLVVKSKVIKMCFLMAVIGGILGVCIGCFVKYMYFVNKGVIFSSNEFKRITEHEVLGVISGDHSEQAYKEIGIKLNHVVVSNHIRMKYNQDEKKNEMTDEMTDGMKDKMTGGMTDGMTDKMTGGMTDKMTGEMTGGMTDKMTGRNKNKGSQMANRDEMTGEATGRNKNKESQKANRDEMAGRVVLFGSMEKEVIESIAKKLQKYVKDKNILALSMTEKDKLVETIYDADAIVLVEACEKTMLPDVLKMKEQVEGANKKLVGNIVLM